MNFGIKLFAASAIVLALLIALLFNGNKKNTQTGSTDPIVFYCAAGMKPPVVEIVKAYQDEYGVEVQVQYGGSGTLLSNLQISPKGDLYLAADQSYIDIANEKGLTAESIPIAELTPVIAVKKGNPKNIASIHDLLRDDVKVALANPDAASVGKVTKELLENAGVWAQLNPKVKVFKPTVNDIANDVKIGIVDAAIIWDSVANQYPELEVIHSPELSKGKQTTTIAVLQNTENPTAALKFARYLSARDKGLQVFDEQGYVAVEGDVWEETPRVVLYSGSVNRVSIDETIKEFEDREGVTVERVYNGCGILVAQMKSGETPDAYFACDIVYSHQVTDIFMDFTNISETKMVILTQKGNPKNINSLKDLTNTGLKVGLCNPEQSALGFLTRRLFQEVDLWESVQDNVRSQVPTGDMLVNQTQTGSLDAAIVYEANTLNVREKLEIIYIDHPKANAIQPYAVGKNSDHRYVMERLFKTITSAQSQQRFKDTGFNWLAKTVMDVAAQNQDALTP